MIIIVSLVAQPPGIPAAIPWGTAVAGRNEPADARHAGAAAAGDDPGAVRVGQLRRVRWAVRLTLAVGVAASVAANVLHALPHPVAKAIAAWPPLALLLTVELISRVPVHRRGLAALRLAATTAIAGIAAWVSYWHMAAVAARYGETGASAYLLPISVDGLIIVASISLVELAGQIRTTDPDSPPVAVPKTPAPPVTAHPATTPGPADPRRVTVPEHHHDTGSATTGRRPTPARRPSNTPPPTEDTPRRASPTPADAVGGDEPATNGSEPVHTDAAGPAPTRRGRPAAVTRHLAEQLIAAQPQLTRAEVAERLGVSPRRLRHVLATPATDAAAPTVSRPQ